MTLNTFHFAGHGAANVTLGIPRLREIVMTASSTIKTPTMRLQIKPDVTQEQIEHFCKTASKVTLSQIVEEVTVDQKLSSKTAENAFSRDTIYTVRMKFYPQEEYTQEFRTNPEEILRSLDRTFSPLFDKEIMKALRTATKGAKLSDVGKAQKIAGQTTETGDNVDAGDAVGAMEDEMAIPKRRGEEEELDMDADDARRAAQTKEVAMYDDADEASDSDEDGQDKILKYATDSTALEAAYASDSDDDDAGSVGSDDIDEAGGDALARKEQRLAKADHHDKMERLERMFENRSKFVQHIEFDKENGEWCTMELQVRCSF